MKKEPVSIRMLLTAVKTPMPRKAPRQARKAEASSDRVRSLIKPTSVRGGLTIIFMPGLVMSRRGAEPRQLGSCKVEVGGLQVAERHVLQGECVRGMGDDHVRSDLLGVGKHRGKVGEGRLIELDHVVIGARRLEVGDLLVAEVRREDEGVDPVKANERAVAGVALRLEVGCG